ncbi:hypothetical protein HanPI659440_Chr13g0505431 [Helianthus annuus]|nr:hypothetical protein HanPI659440_Chr13g0505431 [Helianthus annuus]
MLLSQGDDVALVIGFGANILRRLHWRRPGIPPRRLTGTKWVGVSKTMKEDCHPYKRNNRRLIVGCRDTLPNRRP